jgi:hypothetical protein
MGSLVEFGESGNIPDEFKEDAEADAFEERFVDYHRIFPDPDPCLTSLLPLLDGDSFVQT